MRAIYLLIGFLCMFYLPIPNTSISFLPLLGFALMLFSVLRMEKMEPVFKKSKIALFVALPISAAFLGLQIFKTAGGSAVWFDYVYKIINLLTELCEMAALFFMYVGIKLIGANAEIPSLEKQSSRNMTLMFVYLFILVFFSLTDMFIPSAFSGFPQIKLWQFIIGYIWRALNIWMAFTLLTKVSVSHN